MNSMQCNLENNKMTFFAHKYASDMKAFVSRYCEANDELTLKVNYQQISRNWGNICIFIHDKDAMPLDTGFNGIGRFCNGYFLLINEVLRSKDVQKLSNYDISPCSYKLKLVHNQGKVDLFLALEDAEWNFIKSINEQSSLNKLEIGFIVNVGENQYYNWLFSNYIQLRRDKEVMLPIEYNVHPMKYWKFYTLNPFINFSVERKFNISKINLSVIDYLKRNILCRRYIELRLDEIFFYGSLAYEEQVHHFHEILIYGYSDLHSLFYAVGFYYGKMKKFQISYDNLLIALSDEKVINLFLLEYSLDGYQFRFDPRVVKASIGEYIQGKDSALNFSNLIPVKENVAGIQIYDDFLKDSTNFNQLKCDVHISYVLHEHIKLMTERIDFMLYRKIIEKDEIESIQKRFKEINKISSLLNLLIIKNKVRSIPQIDNKIRYYITEMKTIELESMRDFYTLLDLKYK